MLTGEGKHKLPKHVKAGDRGSRLKDQKIPHISSVKEAVRPKHKLLNDEAKTSGPNQFRPTRPPGLKDNNHPITALGESVESRRSRIKVLKLPHRDQGANPKARLLQSALEGPNKLSIKEDPLTIRFIVLIVCKL